MNMSVHLAHPNGNHRIIKTGFCWLGFLVPSLWAMSEGLWRPFAFSALCANLLTLFSKASDDFQLRSLPEASSLLSLFAGLSAIAYLLTMFCCGLFGRRWMISRLVKHGYVVRRSLPEA
jgi:hypothetical protein